MVNWVILHLLLSNRARQQMHLTHLKGNKMQNITFNDTERFAYVYHDGKFAYKSTGFDWDQMTAERWAELKDFVKDEDSLQNAIDWS